MPSGLAWVVSAPTLIATQGSGRSVVAALVAVLVARHFSVPCSPSTGGGGPGGGGGGGVSYCIYRSASSPSLTGNTCTQGGGGGGGLGGIWPTSGTRGNNGANGAAGNIF